MHEYQRYREIHLYKSNDATYPPHFHSHCEMMFVEKGQVNVIVDGESYTAKQNDAIFIAPHQIHSFSSSHLISVYVMFIAPVLIPEAAEKFKNGVPAVPVAEFVNAEKTDLFLHILRYLIDTYNNINIPYPREDLFESPQKMTTVKSLSKSCISMLLEDMEFVQKPGEAPEIARRILDYCLNNYKFDISLASVSKALNISEHAITRIFKTNFNCGFREYINSLRVSEAAQRLISGTEPISEIAFSVGFDTVRTFNRVFSAINKTTPSEFRNKHKQS